MARANSFTSAFCFIAFLIAVQLTYSPQTHVMAAARGLKVQLTYPPQTHVMAAAHGLAHALGLKGWFDLEAHCGELCVFSYDCVDPGCWACDLNAVIGGGGGFYGACINPDNRFPEIKN